MSPVDFDRAFVADDRAGECLAYCVCPASLTVTG